MIQNPNNETIAMSTDGTLGPQTWRWGDVETLHSTTVQRFMRVLTTGDAEPFGTSGYLFKVVDCPEATQ